MGERKHSSGSPKTIEWEQVLIDALLAVWWTLIPFTLLVFYAIWEFSRKREREKEERIRRLEEEVEKLKKEKE